MFTMKITRDGKEYELTTKELLEASEVLKKNFWLDQLEENFDIESEEAKESIVERAYELYCEGKVPMTEYEALEKAYDEWVNVDDKEVA